VFRQRNGLGDGEEEEEDDDDDGVPARWQIVDGDSGHLAVIEPEPGSECAGDEELAAALSRATSSPVYVLWPDLDSPRVQAFIGGRYAGEVVAWPDSVAAHLGCRFPGMMDAASDGPVDLTPEMLPQARPGERKIAGLTVAQWAHEMRTEPGWDVMLEGAGDERVREAVDALDDADGSVRSIACRLVEAFGVDGLGAHAQDALVLLEKHARSDPDESVRRAARSAYDELRDRIEPD
jgi:hypothetical protein